MPHSRREALRTGLMLSGFTTIQALADIGQVGTAAEAADYLKDHQDHDALTRALQEIEQTTKQSIARSLAKQQAERAALVLYAKQVRALNLPSTRAMRAPFATLPINMVCQPSKEILEIPMPAIPELHGMFLRGWVHLLDVELAHLMHALAPLSKGGRPPVTVESFSAISEKARQHRVVSPLWTVDQEEPSFTMRTTATILIDSVLGILDEWYDSIEDAERMVRDSGNVPGTPVMERLPIKCHVDKTGFLIQFMAWQTGRGYVPNIDIKAV